VRGRVIEKEAPLVSLRCCRCGRRSARVKFIPDEGLVCRQCLPIDQAPAQEGVVNEVEELDGEQPVYAVP
jgi:recombinational DNA repair protein (RecF pathway)